MFNPMFSLFLVSVIVCPGLAVAIVDDYLNHRVVRS